MRKVYEIGDQNHPKLISSGRMNSSPACEVNMVRELDRQIECEEVSFVSTNFSKKSLIPNP